MSHSVHPYAHRLGTLRDWKSRWFGDRRGYVELLKTDVLLREYLEKQLRGLYVDSIEIERGQTVYRLIIKTSRPGLLIGRSGEGSLKLRKNVLAFFKRIRASVPKELRIDIEEVRAPESHAAIVAQMIAESLEKRMPHRRVMKQMVQKVVANKNVKGVKIALSGRLGGSDIGRKEYLKEGRIPLQTLRADIDFAREKAHLPYGDLGIKVWIYRGEDFDQ